MPNIHVKTPTHSFEIDDNGNASLIRIPSEAVAPVDIVTFKPAELQAFLQALVDDMTDPHLRPMVRMLVAQWLAK